MDLDTLKSAIIGSGGITIQFLDMLPEIVRISVGIITIIYFIFFARCKCHILNF